MSGLRTLVALLNQRVRPFVLPNAHVSPSASVIGNVAIADHVFIKPNAVLRGDSLVPDDLIRLGGYTVIGENTVLNAAVQIGSWCRVGAACSIGRAARIGNVVTLGDGTIVGAGAEIPHEVCTEPRTVIPDGAQLEPNARYAGNPATRVGEWSGFDVEESKKRAQAECALGAQMRTSSCLWNERRQVGLACPDVSPRQACMKEMTHDVHEGIGFFSCSEGLPVRCLCLNSYCYRSRVDFMASEHWFIACCR